MAKPTLTAWELNERVTTYTQEYLENKLINQSFTVSPLFDKCLNRGRDVGGANEIVVPVKDAYTPVGGWFVRGGTIAITHVDPFTTARYTWSFKQESVYLDYTDEEICEGDGANLRYIEESVDNGLERFYEGLATDFCATTTATNGFTCLFSLIDATGAIGGLNPATTGQEFWAATETNSIGGSGAFANALRNAFRETSKYKGLGSVDIIACSKTAYDEYEKSGLNLTTLMATGGAQGSADIGIKNLQYKGVPVVYEPHLDAAETSLNGVMLGINSRWLKICKKPKDPMKFGGWVDMLPANRVARAGLFKGAFATVLYARRPHFKLTGITA